MRCTPWFRPVRLVEQSRIPNRSRCRKVLRQAISACAEPLEDRRLLSAGDLDPTFGVGGKVTTDITTSIYNSGQQSVIQPDGKIVVAAYVFGPAGGDMGISRYNTNGTLDTSFGGGDG